MSFDNANYPNRKDHRKPYRHERAVDRTCRSHGSCPWCIGRRKWKIKHRMWTLAPEDREYWPQYKGE